MVCPVFSDVNVLIGIVECVNKRHQDDATDDEEDSGEEDDIDDEVSDKAMKTGKKKHLYFKRTRIMAEKMRRASTIVVDGLKKLKRMNSKSSKYHSIKRERHLNPGGFTTTDMKRLEVLVQYNANGIQGEGKDMVTMALKIVNSYMQFIGLARGFRVDWPSLLRDVQHPDVIFYCWAQSFILGLRHWHRAEWYAVVLPKVYGIAVYPSILFCLWDTILGNCISKGLLCNREQLQRF